MINFRDIGGCKSSDGRTVKKGLFFRSGNLANLSSDDIQTLRDLNIKLVFDYRSEEESKENPTEEIENIEYIRVSAMNMDDMSAAKFGSVKEMLLNMFENENAFNMLKERYYDLPVNNKSYKRLVELIRDENNLPILTHCTAGKDRTGVGCAIILMILGVSREDIIKDYLKSNQSAQDAIEEIMKVQPELKNVPEEKLKYLFGVNEDYINEAFRRIDEDYKTTEEYLYNEFGLTVEDLKELRDRYLY
ncbi:MULTISPECIES: tyrosine-protein phosphatase [Romboutsia]|uniref:Protein-tyrosine phosphatase n=1 Tax=Romboutsia hominis TaxID=1507512 RepID=A0A2P2BT65_9FIRM|nr:MULTISPECIES: tyrosine-protein phosphatase [Romboutsia]MCH1960806.1 tyrosine-protein phosphatase [Romboutsia hominis]MCH1968761.1 tyrosine-protein phosphatase [Romboutsia hominis]MDB8804361.1 tyrosine-protein phosphatase [Romboutsia sp. 1001216sp1]MDB8807681.1 tyrosine-protein phosphatase [Romboutsia sp. 1001216sp1]MDB8810007.1 tyrosine-protein phosphatase [Romboutsia sp. 1001216sp1]